MAIPVPSLNNLRRQMTRNRKWRSFRRYSPERSLRAEVAEGTEVSFSEIAVREDARINSFE